MKKILTILFSVLILSNYSLAQKEFILFQADYASFAGMDGKSFTEVYTAVFQSELSYNTEDSVKVAHFEYNIKVFAGDSLISEQQRGYKNTLALGQEPNILNQFMDVFAFELVPGEYDLVATLTDLVTAKSGTFNIKMNVPDYSSQLSISHIEIATQAKKAVKPSNFSNKNNIEIYPNPSRVFGLLYPVMYYYFEAYNLKADPSGGVNYTYHYFISDLEGNIIRDFPEKTRNRNSTTIAEANGSNVIALPSQIYFLNIELIDHVANDTVRSRSNFIVKKLSKKSEPGGVAAQENPAAIYSAFSEEELKDEFNKAKYIATSEEKDIFEELDADGMRRFLAEFWKRRDPNPATAPNEYKQEYLENVELAELRYSSNFRAGWKSDRGRVLLIYGKPDEIERFPSTIDVQPHEKWYYYALDGGSEFIFGDLSGHGEYELIHSTYRNELQDPNWRQRLGGQSTSGFDGF
jgi:GWxTD domain-containing protein